eukprot:10697663-Lingulodinium_polyedra.AAC.1
MTARAVGSSRRAGLRKPKTISAATLVAPCVAVLLAALRSPCSSATCADPRAAPWMPAAVPAAAPM